MAEHLLWERDGLDWPLRSCSRFVAAAGIRWHVQEWSAPQLHAASPVIVLLHGTGSSTHSWRDLMPLLGAGARVLSMDLPGHAFTQMPPQSRMSLPGMAESVAGLLSTLQVAPDVLVGHSAGAAIAVRMVLSGLATPRHVVSLNGALLPLGGLPGQLFSPVARVLAALPLVPEFFSWRASDPRVLERLMDSTGSRIDAQGMALYGRLVASSGHAHGALAMMSQWDLASFARDLPALSVPLHLVVGLQDGTVPPAQAQQVKDMVRVCSVSPWPGLGHLAHEEQAADIAALILRIAGA